MTTQVFRVRPVAISAIVLAMLLLWSAGKSSFAEESAKRVTLIYTNDTLGNLEPCG
ncbi:MAG: hypothetical protein HYX78_03765 [Armatimonadetes bacterium]|nr:hypothetical protein [Armatimonadota bacterium]